MKKLTRTEIRRLINEEVSLMNKRRRPTLMSVLFEADESGGSNEPTFAGKPIGKPKGTAYTDQLNFAEFKDNVEGLREVFAQILTKDPNQPIFKAMGPNANPEKVAAWLIQKGPDTVAGRIKTVGSKLPQTGLPKSMMPFLPGPSDAQGTVDQVEDALKPGGDFNVDFAESRKSVAILERWSKLAGLITEKVDPPNPNTFVGMNDDASKYMKSGANDGKPDDDTAAFNRGAKIGASAAIPTQSNVLLPKALGMAVGGVEGGDLGAYFSTDGEILDGHHRWAATMLNNPTAELGGFASIDLNAMGGRETGLKHLTAIGNALGNKTKTA